MKHNSKKACWPKVCLHLFLITFGVLGINIALAQGGDMSLSTVAGNITKTFGNVAKLITAGSYIAGMGFAVGAILKFKAHKDNPQQIPVGTPLALLFVAAALLFMPEIFKMSGATIFGGSATAGSVTGQSSF